MAKVKRYGASPFIREQLEKNPKITGKEVAETWKAAGNKITFSPTLFYQVKGRLRLTNSRGRGRPRKRYGGLERIERELDGLVAQADDLGEKKVAESLRGARRVLAGRLV